MRSFNNEKITLITKVFFKESSFKFWSVMNIITLIMDLLLLHLSPGVGILQTEEWPSSTSGVSPPTSPGASGSRSQLGVLCAQRQHARPAAFPPCFFYASYGHPSCTLQLCAHPPSRWAGIVFFTHGPPSHRWCFYSLTGKAQSLCVKLQFLLKKWSIKAGILDPPRICLGTYIETVR